MVNPVLVFVVPDSPVWSEQMSRNLPIGWDTNNYRCDDIADKNCCVILMDDRSDTIGAPVHANHDADVPLLVIQHRDKQGMVPDEWGRYCRMASFHHINDNPVVKAVNDLLDGKLEAVEFSDQWGTEKQLQDLDALAAICQAGILGADNQECQRVAKPYLGDLMSAWNTANIGNQGAAVWEKRLSFVREKADAIMT